MIWAHYLDRLDLQEALAAGPVSLRIRGIATSPHGYLTYHQVEDQLPAGITWSDRRDRMATVVTPLHDAQPHRSARPLTAYVMTDRVYLPNLTTEVRPPGSTTLYVTPGVPFAFETMATWPITADPRDVPVGWQTSKPRRFERGERTEMPWLKAPYGPALSTTTTGTEGETLPLAYRSGDKLNLNLPMFTNSPGTGRRGWYDPGTDTGSTTLSRDGKRIGHNDVPGIAGFDLPAGPGRYELTVDAGYRLPGWPLATRVTEKWSFTSSGERAGPLPLLDVEYDLPLDLTNAAPAGKELTGAVQVAQQVGAERTGITSVRLEVSYDDGAIWQRAVVDRDGPRWSVRIPAGASGREFASLRTTATDTAGNKVTETLVRAYRLT
ncbi:hypothetical protein [Actinophytocola xanthii]|uniref:Uncharacterized protein n=1 Tax=Actinophytocola xanthii TaxID=1912961 RepID=A0A1Q8CKE5_9PSEU|nr:hypothetical protein [Actinophytocola xanthii]OLF14826.1 hypothetical protein BU204_25035 [Actinophytocola xanthii]